MNEWRRTRPQPDEYNPYFDRYISRVPEADIIDVLGSQIEETVALLKDLPETMGGHRYAPDKWSIREVVNHLSDTERLFAFRALWFARGFDSPLPSFEQDIAVREARADERPWSNLLDDFEAVRGATVTFFSNRPAEAWTRRGIASGNPFSVRALAYIAAGHTAHHMRLLREQYL